MPLQLLGFRFQSISASDLKPESYEMIRENFHDLTHFYMSMDDQTRGTGCVHSKASGCAGFMPNFHVESPDLGITGTPCQPFSRQRVKRSAPGSVAGHKAYDTTFTDLVCWLHSFEPKVAIVEQVEGMDIRESSACPTSPLQQPLGWETPLPEKTDP